MRMGPPPAGRFGVVPHTGIGPVTARNQARDATAAPPVVVTDDRGGSMYPNPAMDHHSQCGGSGDEVGELVGSMSG